MKTSVVWAAVAMVVGCTRASSGAGAAPSAVSAAPIASAMGTAAPSTCGPNAYRHENPSFCVELPPALRGKAPTPIENGVMFSGMTIQWADKTDTARVAAWKKPERGPEHVGTFEVWATEPMPKGTWFQVYDATQHRVNDIYKVPSVSGAAVVEGEKVVRCAVIVSIEHREEPRKVAEQRASDLAACKSLRVPRG